MKINLFDQLRLAHEHVKLARSADISLIEPYRSLLACCESILNVIRIAYGLPSPLPREDEDWLKGFDIDLSHGVSSTDIDF